MQEDFADKKLALEKVHTADVCTKALLGDRIRYVCYSEEAMANDSENWSLSQLDESCRCEKFEQTCDAESEGAC